MTRRDALKWGGLFVFSGCQSLFRQEDHAAEVDVAGKLLKPIPTLRDGIRLDVFRIDRLIGDPRIGASAEPMQRPRTRLTEEEVDAMRTARANGVSVNAIAHHFDVHRGTVWAKTRPA